MDNGRLQEIKDGNYLLHGTEEWTNQEDADIEAVIKELIAAYETSQRELAEAEADRDRAIVREADEYAKQQDTITDLRAQLAEAQQELAEVKDKADNFMALQEIPIPDEMRIESLTLCLKEILEIINGRE